MKLKISTKNYGVIISDELDLSKREVLVIIDKALTNEGYLRCFVEKLTVVIPYDVLSTSLIKIVE